MSLVKANGQEFDISELFYQYGLPLGLQNFLVVFFVTNVVQDSHWTLPPISYWDVVWIASVTLIGHSRKPLPKCKECRQ